MGSPRITWACFPLLRPSPEEALQWRDSLEKLLQNPCKFTCPCGTLHMAWGAQGGLGPSCTAGAQPGLPAPCPPDGLASFRSFLRSEFSEENAEFWVACEDYKKTKSPVKMAEKAKKIYEEFIQTEAPKEVSGHGAGDGSGRDEAAALSAPSQSRAMAARLLVPWLKGSEGCTAILHNPAAPICRSASAGLSPAMGCHPLPYRGRDDNVQ